MFFSSLFYVNFLLFSAVETVSQQFMFPTSDAPTFGRTHGYAFGIGWVVVMVVWCGLVLPLIERRYRKLRPEY